MSNPPTTPPTTAPAITSASLVLEEEDLGIDVVDADADTDVVTDVEAVASDTHRIEEKMRLITWHSL